MQAHENAQHPIAQPDAIEAVELRMEQQVMTVKDMLPMIGASDRVYELLSKKRPLTLLMTKRIRVGLQISGDVWLAHRAAKPAVKPKTRQPPVP